MIVDILNHALLISGFVGVMMLVIEYINVLTRGAWQKGLAGSRLVQYLVAVLLGATPGCLGAFAVVAMYSHGVLPLGALVATMIATSGDESFVMLAMIPQQALLLTGLLAVIGFVVGWLTDLTIGKKIGDLPSCDSLDLHSEGACECFPSGEILRQLRKMTLARGVLLGALSLFLFGIVSGTVGPPVWNWIRVSLILTDLIAMFIVATVPEHFLQEHLWRHVALKHIHGVFLWTLGALIVTRVITHYLDVGGVIRENTLLMIVIAALVGIIPESGPHLVFTTFYAQGIIPFVVLLTSSIVQDGHGMLPLLAHSRKQFILVKSVNLTAGVSIGLIVFVIGLLSG